jgi:hypothetical protein
LSPAPAAAASSATPAASDYVSPESLELAELELREAFHSSGADISAAPVIWSSNKTVFFHTFTKNPEVAASIKETASGIPHVKEDDKPIARPSDQPKLFDESVSDPSSPPVASELQAQFGNARAVSTFLTSLRAHSSHVIAEADALDQLGKRYPEEKIKALPPDLRTRVNRLATSMLSSLQQDAKEYVKSLSPTLDAMAHTRNIPEPGDDDSNLPGCLTWQQNASLAAPSLRTLANDASSLFISRPEKTAESATTDSLVSDSLKMRSFLELHLMSTCQLFRAN